MIPLWQLSLLSINGVEEFSFTYCEEQNIFIDGKKIKGDWVISVRVIATPHFAWGFNKQKSELSTPKEIIRYYLTKIFNQLSDKSAKGREKILSLIKSDLQSTN